MEKSKQTRGACDGLVYTMLDWGVSGNERGSYVSIITCFVDPHITSQHFMSYMTFAYRPINILEKRGVPSETSSKRYMPCPDLRESSHLSTSCYFGHYQASIKACWIVMTVLVRLCKAYIGLPKGLQLHLPDLSGTLLSTMYRSLG